MSEIERTQATIARVTAKRDAAKDEEAQWYYAQCLVGWWAWLKKLGAWYH